MAECEHSSAPAFHVRDDATDQHRWRNIRQCQGLLDRIIPASLTYAADSLSASARRPVTRAYAELLLKASYAVKTQAGISDQSYQFQRRHFYREGQGTRWPPQRGLVVGWRWMPGISYFLILVN
jgi:hypothetical protein